VEALGCPAFYLSEDIMPKGPAFQTQESVIERFKAAHGDRYDYSKVAYRAAVDKVEIVCSTHGSFWQTPLRHYSGYGCKACAMMISEAAKVKAFASRRGQPAKHRKSFDEFLQEAERVHGKQYDYSEAAYQGYHARLIIICPDHGRFEQAPAKHISMQRGCPKCGRQTSKMADAWLDSLAVPVREYRLPERRLRAVDGFNPETNTVYQFHGDFFHGNPKLFSPDATNPLTKQKFGVAFERTLKFDDEIRRLGYNLVVIWEDEYKKRGPKPPL
jgi:G:T-mismatch repair DNA endonuclease (very short patch repair protein)